MKDCPPTVGGWTHYCLIVKEAGVVLGEPEVKRLMKMYINAVPVDKAIKDMKNVSD